MALTELFIFCNLDIPSYCVLFFIGEYDLLLHNKKYNLSYRNISKTDESLQWHTFCGCCSSAFSYKPAGHVVTGDMNIMSN